MRAIDSVFRHRLTVEAFHRLAKAGVFKEAARIELIEGDLIDMAPSPLWERRSRAG